MIELSGMIWYNGWNWNHESHSSNQRMVRKAAFLLFRTVLKKCLTAKQHLLVIHNMVLYCITNIVFSYSNYNWSKLSLIVCELLTHGQGMDGTVRIRNQTWNVFCIFLNLYLSLNNESFTVLILLALWVYQRVCV